MDGAKVIYQIIESGSSFGSVCILYSATALAADSSKMHGSMFPHPTPASVPMPKLALQIATKLFI